MILVLTFVHLSPFLSIPAESQQALLGITYETLLTTSKGHDLCRELVTAVINKQMGHHMSVSLLLRLLNLLYIRPSLRLLTPFFLLCSYRWMLSVTLCSVSVGPSATPAM